MIIFSFRNLKNFLTSFSFAVFVILKECMWYILPENIGNISVTIVLRSPALRNIRYNLRNWGLRILLQTVKRFFIQNATFTWRSGYCYLKGECNLNQSKDCSFVERVARNNSWNNGDRHKIYEIFPINCFVFVITLVWKTVHSSSMTPI